MNFDDLYLLPGSEELSRRYNALASNYSDFHKDFYGTRPRNIIGCADRFGSHDELVEGMSHLRRLMDGLNASFEAMKVTFEGRESLREDGWIVEETDPELVARAWRLRVEREERRELERKREELALEWARV